MGLFHDILSGEIYKVRKYGIYKGLILDYFKYFPQLPYVFSIHRKGFRVSDWEILNLSNANYKAYLNSKQYFGMHPINGYFSRMIDDKMNIKYVFFGTSISNVMPEYYYIIDEYGNIRSLMDCDTTETVASGKDILQLLEAKKQLALKRVTGAIGKGFYKLEYCDGGIKVNDRLMGDEEFEAFLRNLKNYLICEYLKTNPYLAEFWPETTNTIRYLYGQVNGEWRMINSFIRFGSKKTGVVENFNRGGILCYIDEEGRFNGGYVLVKDGKHKHSKPVEYHPDTNKKLEGVIPCWNEIQKAAEDIGMLLPQTRYLGLDFVVTDDYKVKLLEINSLTSLDSIQIDGSILKTENGRWFFSSVLNDQ